MKLSKASLLILFIPAAIVTGCTNRDVKTKEADFGKLFFDYSISADENLDQVTCMFQFRTNDAEGHAINVEPAKVLLDGEQIEADSAKRSGFFYEVHKPIKTFSGQHTISFVTPDNTQYSNEFEFYPFTLAEELPRKIRRKPFTIRLKNFPENETEVRLLMLDTAFTSMGFNEMVPVSNGEIEVGSDVLNNLKNGPVNFEIYMEKEAPLQQATKGGGRISITYGLKREFELVK